MRTRRGGFRERAYYRRTNCLLLGLLAVYLALVVYVERVPGKEEVFPFASWSLFSMVPNEYRDYSLRLLEMGDGRLSRPAYFEDAGDVIPWVAHNGARMAIQHLGDAAEHRREQEVAEVRKYLEALYLGGHKSLKYQVVARRYDPLERWRTGHFREERTLATFEATDAVEANKTEPVLLEPRQGHSPHPAGKREGT
jgi:hypothetical protein